MKTTIIAEIGVNHDGNMYKAFRLIDAAKRAGADFAKFQAFTADALCVPQAKKANYQKLTDTSDNQFIMLKKLQLNERKIFQLYKYSKKKKIKFLLSVFDETNLEIIKKLNLEYIKIPSGELTNYPLLRKISKLKKSIILSTGMSNVSEIKKSVNFLQKNGLNKTKISLLHCNTEYPTPLSDVNLLVIKKFKEIFKCNIGLSDHSKSTIVPALSVAIGAKIIEKHLTLNNLDPGPDHFASLNEKEFTEMVKNIKDFEIACGSPIKKLTKSEKKNIIIVRKSIVASKQIKKGELFSTKNLTTKRPATGLSPIHWDKIIGKKSRKNYRKNQIIK